MKIISWNVNGIRSVFRNGFLKWLKTEDPDIVCIQETKAAHIELAESFSKIDGYFSYFNSSLLRKGHSGVAVYTKLEPKNIETKLGIDRFDQEGRVLKLVFEDFNLFNFYIPHGDRTKINLKYKISVYKDLLQILKPLAQNNTILTGDFNIAHTELDLYFPKQNQNSIMFTSQERKQIDELISLGYTDVFRRKYPDNKTYTWWPYYRNLRKRDIGWRLDYFFVSKSMLPLVKDILVQKNVLGSDHAPVELVLDKKIDVINPPAYGKEEVQSVMFE